MEAFGVRSGAVRERSSREAFFQRKAELELNDCAVQDNHRVLGFSWSARGSLSLTDDEESDPDSQSLLCQTVGPTVQCTSTSVEA